MDRRFEAVGYVAVLLGALLACKEGEKAGGSAPAQTTGAAAPTPAKETTISVTAKDLANDYHANEVAADEKYKGKRLDVAGRVLSIDKDAFDNMIVHMATDNEFLGIMATMTDDSKSAVVKLSKGQPVMLRCTGGGMVIGSPVLSDCIVFLTEKDLPPKAAAPAAVAPKKK